MEANCHPFFGLEADADPSNDLRKSRLMLANSFRVGTFFSSSRFCFSSTKHPLDFRFELKAKFHRVLWMAAIVLKAFQQFVNEKMVWAAYRSEPFLAAVRTCGVETIVFLDGNVNARRAARTFKLESLNVAHFNYDSLFGSHFASKVIL
jgi:hypothetical protein